MTFLQVLDQQRLITIKDFVYTNHIWNDRVGLHQVIS